MKRLIERKIPGGKLVRVEAEFSHTIDYVKITGDFFLHPEEVLEKIVAACTGLPVPFESKTLQLDLLQIIQEQKAQFIGVAVEDIVSMLEEAVS